MKTKYRLAGALRKIANKIDPPVESRERGIHFHPADVYSLDGFGQGGHIFPPPDWTWTQDNGGEPSGNRYL